MTCSSARYRHSTCLTPHFTPLAPVPEHGFPDMRFNYVTSLTPPAPSTTDYCQMCHHNFIATRSSFGCNCPNEWVYNCAFCSSYAHKCFYPSYHWNLGFWVSRGIIQAGNFNSGYSAATAPLESCVYSDLLSTRAIKPDPRRFMPATPARA